MITEDNLYRKYENINVVIKDNEALGLPCFHLNYWIKIDTLLVKDSTYILKVTSNAMAMK